MPFNIPGLTDRSPSDAQSHFVHSYAKTTDHHISKLANVTSGYIRNLERTQKKTLKMGRLVKQFSETEEGDFRYMLADFADMLIEKEAERADLIVRMQVMCQDPLKTYSILCQKLKDEAKTRDSAVTKEANKQHQLNRVMMKEGANRPKLNQSQMELAGASHEVSQATETLAQSIQTFEEKKRDHLKSVLSEFLWSEIKYHGKMLEILTVHHQKLGETAFTDDVSRLVDKMKTHPAPPSLSPVRSLMR